MPVDIPRINRNAPVEPGPSNRLQTQAVETSGAFAQQANAVGKLVSDAVQVFHSAEQDAYNAKISELGHQLDRFGRTRLEGNPDEPGTGLRHLQGNPDEAYDKFDDELATERDRLLSESGLTGNALEKARGVLNKRYNTLYNSSLTYYGIQRINYQRGLAKDSVEIAKRDAFDGLGFYDANEPSTLEPFAQALDDIRQTRIQEALIVGSAQEVSKDAEGEKYRVLGDDGEVKYVRLGESVKFQISKDVSDATYESINGMVKGGRINEARELIKIYGKQIDPVNKAKLDETFEKKEIEDEAFRALGKLADLPSKQRMARLRGMKSNTARQAKIKQEAMKQLDANIRFQENEKNRASDNVYNQIANQMEELTDPARAGNKLVDSTVAMENTIVEVDGRKAPVKDFLPDITKANQQKALFGLVEKRPKGGDDVAYGELMDAAGNNSMVGMSFSQLQERARGLSEKQWSDVKSVWRYMNVESDSQERSRINSARKEVEREMQVAGVISKNGRGRYSARERRMLNEIQSRVSQDVTLGQMKNATTKDISDFAKKTVADFQRENGGDSDGIFGSLLNAFGAPGTGQVTQPNQQANEFDRLPQDSKMKLINEFKRRNPDESPTLPKLRDFYQESFSDASE